MRGIPGINGWLVTRVLPADPLNMTATQRFTASVWLAIQSTLAILGAVLLGMFILFGLLDLLSMLGVGLLQVAEFAYILAGGELSPGGLEKP